MQYLYVAPEFRRRGIASSLLRLMARWFHEHAAIKVCVDVGSPAAERFYHSLGASPLSPLKKYRYVWEDMGACSHAQARKALAIRNGLAAIGHALLSRSLLGRQHSIRR